MNNLYILNISIEVFLIKFYRLLCKQRIMSSISFPVIEPLNKELSLIWDFMCFGTNQVVSGQECLAPV